MVVTMVPPLIPHVFAASFRKFETFSNSARGSLFREKSQNAVQVSENGNQSTPYLLQQPLSLCSSQDGFLLKQLIEPRSRTRQMSPIFLSSSSRDFAFLLLLRARSHLCMRRLAERSSSVRHPECRAGI